MPIFWFFFLYFLDFFDFFGFLKLLMGGLIKVTRLYRNKLHGFMCGWWRCGTCDSCFLYIVRVFNRDLLKSLNQLIIQPNNHHNINHNNSLPSCLVYHCHLHHFSHQFHSICDCQAFRTMNIDCAYPSYQMVLALRFIQINILLLSTKSLAASSFSSSISWLVNLCGRIVILCDKFKLQLFADLYLLFNFP